MSRGAIIVTLLLVVAQAATSQRSGAGLVEGTVLRLGTGEPLSEVDVELARLEGTAGYPLGPLTYPPGDFSPGIVIRPTYPNPADLLRARTKTDGRFSFSNLPPVESLPADIASSPQVRAMPPENMAV